MLRKLLVRITSKYTDIKLKSKNIENNPSHHGLIESIAAGTSYTNKDNGVDETADVNKSASSIGDKSETKNKNGSVENLLGSDKKIDIRESGENEYKEKCENKLEYNFFSINTSTVSNNIDRNNMENVDQLNEVLLTKTIYPKTEVINRRSYNNVHELTIIPESVKGKENIFEIYGGGLLDHHDTTLQKLPLPKELVLDEDFLRKLFYILELPSVNLRKRKYGELLGTVHSLSTTTLDTLEGSKSKLTRCFGKKKGRKYPKKIVIMSRKLLNRSVHAGDPELHRDHSFYRYRVRSKLEGLAFVPRKVYKYGERGSGFHVKGEPQDFEKLREQCLKNKILFEDPEFPATKSSLFVNETPMIKLEWKRPPDIVKKPSFVAKGFSKFDVVQGQLGNYCLLAALANLVLYKPLLMEVVPDDQSFDKNYAGIFHFRFWAYGRWIDVVVDDLLPTFEGHLEYLQSPDGNEFWSSLLEKAYAKLHGSYEALKECSICEIMEDLTGGVSEIYKLKHSPPNMFEILSKAYERWSPMGCYIEQATSEFGENRTPEGLIPEHAYIITKITQFTIDLPLIHGRFQLVRLRDPWGNKSDWEGPWADRSVEWQYFSEQQRKEFGLAFDNDGEFWMSFEDFVNKFTHLEICNLDSSSVSESLTPPVNKKWVVSSFEGEWVRGVTAGGCRNFIKTYHFNPQYRITLEEVDEGDNEVKCTLIVALLQKRNKCDLRSFSRDLTIGFSIFPLPTPHKIYEPLDRSFFENNVSIAKTRFIDLREVSCRIKLPPGNYCIVPSTFRPDEEGEFLLRVFSEHQNNLKELDQSLGIVEELLVREEKHKPDKKMIKLFKKASSEDEMGWCELKEILDKETSKLNIRGFSKDVCRSMITMMRTNRPGKLNFEEFERLFMLVKNWKKSFEIYDRHENGTLSGFLLRNAMNTAGYSLNNRILNTLMQIYGHKNGKIEFDDFIMCCVKLKILLELLLELAESGEYAENFDLDQYIDTTLYA